MKSKIKSDLSVVIPTLGRPILVQTLDALIRTQGFETLDVIVVGRVHDAVIADKIAKLVDCHAQIRHIEVSYEKGDSSEKKNVGWRAAFSEIVAFLDDDVVVAPDWPLRMREAFHNPEVALVSGPGLVPPDAGRFARLAGLALSSPAAGYAAWRYRKGEEDLIPISWSKIIGCNMAYRRTVIEKIGGFDPAFWPGEEMLAAFRAQQSGYSLCFYSPAFCYHYPRQSFIRFWKQVFGYGATRIRLMRSGVQFEPSTLVPAVWVATMVLSLVGGLWRIEFIAFFSFVVMSYAFADAFITLFVVRETRRLSDLLLFFVIPIMHISYGVACWWEVLNPNRDFSIKAYGRLEDRNK